MTTTKRASGTLLDKVWARRLVSNETPETPALLYVDLHLLNEVTSPHSFAVLRERKLPVRRPDLTFGFIDHSVPTLAPNARGELPYASAEAQAQVAAFRRNCKTHNIRLADTNSARHGIAHVSAPEMGLTRPGTVVVCGDSHTSTHGAFGALAFGIGSTEISHVLATQCLMMRKPKNFLVRVDGKLGDGVSAKDLALFLMSRIGPAGGAGCVIEYAGETVRALSMEERMTLCNMSIEAGARAGMIAPDEKTAEWVGARSDMSRDEFEFQSKTWPGLASDPDAVFDRELRIDAREIAPMATWGTSPSTAIPVGAEIPPPRSGEAAKALAYMGFAQGQKLTATPIDLVFIGSCTNGRLSDLRIAASILRGKKIKPGVRVLVAPGSEQVRLEAEREGLDKVFLDAGAEWRRPGCSLCIAMNGDIAPPGGIAVSTSNRNFEGRQGKGARTILASPATAAAAAVNGAICDPRPLLSGKAG